MESHVEQSRPLRRATVRTGTSRKTLSGVQDTPDRVWGDGEGLHEQIDPGPDSLERLPRHRGANALGGVDKPAELAEDVHENLVILVRSQRLTRVAAPKITSSKYWTMPRLRGPAVSTGAVGGEPK